MTPDETPTEAPDPGTQSSPAPVGAGAEGSAAAPDFQRPEDKPNLTDEERDALELDRQEGADTDTPPLDAEAPAEDAPEGALGRASTLVDHASPAGAVWPDQETGAARQHGESTPGLGVTPASADDDTAERNEPESQVVSEPEQIDTERPDIGTP